MSRNLTPKGKLVRRFGVNLFGNTKYDRLLERKPAPPGQLRRRRRASSEYAKRLTEKQKLKFCYGLTERQFRRLFERARRRSRSHAATPSGVVGSRLCSAASWRLMRRGVSLRQVFVDYAYTLVPMGLAAWIAFSLGFVLVNGSYALSVLSDPFGWGWNLFGTAEAPWSPAAPGIIGFLQTGVLVAGLLFSVQTAYKIARQHVNAHRAAFAAMLPVCGFLTLITLSFLWLYLG